MRNIITNVAAAIGICLLVGACTGNSTNPADLGLVVDTLDTGNPVQDITPNTTVSWPEELPADYLQPWEELNSEGFAVPAAGWPRATNSLNLDSDFQPGHDRYLEDGDVSTFGEAASIASGTEGAKQLSYATYRILGGGAPLGIVTADVNVKLNGLTSPSEYWLGVADFDKGGWSWHGPFTDSHVRLQMPGDNYLTSFGNYFICVAAYDGASFDVVGIGVNSKNPLDATPPSTIQSLVNTDYNSSTLLEWLPVPDSDLAGYRVYYNKSPFVVPNQTTPRVNYLIGDNKFLLPGLNRQTYVRVTAVDISGNESDVSEQVICNPLEDPTIDAILEVDVASGMKGDTFNLTAVGGDTYDFDIDGDGTFDIMGNGNGMATLIADQTGIIRPMVRASSTDGMSVQMCAVSLIVGSNGRPVALGYSDVAQGNAPLSVNFEGVGYDYDGYLIGYAWDFDGNGSWDYVHGSNPDPPTHVYTEGGVYNAKFRVLDNDGAWDVDTVTIHVKEFVGFDWNSPTNHTGPMYPDFAIVDGNPAFTYQDTISSTLWFVRATNSSGTQWADPLIIDPIPGAGLFSSLAVIDGRPAVAYFDAGLNYLIADDPQGSSWSTPRVLLDIGGTSYKVSLEVVSGNPAVGYIGPGAAQFIRADSIDGSTWGNPMVVVDNSGGVNQSIDMEVIDGNPAMAYYDGGKAYYIRATSSTGNVVGDWGDPRVNVSGVANCGGWVALEQVNGRPAISYMEVTGTTLVAYHRALNSTGQTGLDWAAGYIEIESGAGCGQWSNLGVVNGLPVVCFFMAEGFPNYYYCSASNPEGTSWDNPIGILDGFTMTVGEYPVVLENNGAPYIGCYNLSTSQLFFAHSVFE